MSKQRYVVKFTYSSYVGKYAKLGGGSTNDLQEANVIGWLKGKSKYHWYPERYELIPVTIIET